MKPQNNKDVRKGILHFSLYLTATVAVAVFIYFCFMKTSSTEVDRILSKTVEYDNVQMKQIRLSESVDTVFYYMNILSNDPKINNLMMYNYISNRKIALADEVTRLQNEDVRFYKTLVSRMNFFLSLKDSIRASKREQEMIRADLERCIADNRKITRKMSIGGLTY